MVNVSPCFLIIPDAGSVSVRDGSAQTIHTLFGSCLSIVNCFMRRAELPEKDLKNIRETVPCNIN